MAPWAPPTPGDIVWCRFPNLPRRSPGPKPRPALVCGVIEREDGVAVAVPYGTSQGLNRLYGGELAITRQGTPAAYGSASLSYFRQRVELPWNEDFSGCRRMRPIDSTRSSAASTRR